MSKPTRLYTTSEVAGIIGWTRQWVMTHVDRGSGPPVEFVTMRGDRPTNLWTEDGIDHWRRYAAGDESTPQTQRYPGYSDHHAVNHLGPVMVTWKLWWQCLPDGGTRWWFSTPRGWATSDNDGRTWQGDFAMVRPNEYRYLPVNDSVMSGTTRSVLRSAEKLRRNIERGQ